MSFDLNVEVSELRRVPFLSGLSNQEAEALCLAGEVRLIDGGTVIFRQGDPGQELFVILEGEVAIEMAGPTGATRLLAALGPGTVFGEINYLVGSERTASARALRETRVVVFSRDAVDNLEGPGRRAAAILTETIARVLALRLSRVNREMGVVRSQLEEVIAEANDDLREWRAQHSAVAHLASELRDLADRAGASMGRLATLVREADRQNQSVLHSWRF